MKNGKETPLDFERMRKSLTDWYKEVEKIEILYVNNILKTISYDEEIHKYISSICVTGEDFDYVDERNVPVKIKKNPTWIRLMSACKVEYIKTLDQAASQSDAYRDAEWLIYRDLMRIEYIQSMQHSVLWRLSNGMDDLKKE